MVGRGNHNHSAKRAVCRSKQASPITLLHCYPSSQLLHVGLCTTIPCIKFYYKKHLCRHADRSDYSVVDSPF